MLMLRVDTDLMKWAESVLAQHSRGNLRTEWLQSQSSPSCCLLSSATSTLKNPASSERKVTLTPSYSQRRPAPCLISRFVGEEKLVLWNTSDLWPQNSSVPEDLKKRLVSMANISSYMIQNLTYSDSGLYLECWSEGKVTYQENITIHVCGSIGEIRDAVAGDTWRNIIPVSSAADKLDVQWLKLDYWYEQEIWTRVFGDNTASVMDNDRW